MIWNNRATRWSSQRAIADLLTKMRGMLIEGESNRPPLKPGVAVPGLKGPKTPPAFAFDVGKSLI